MAREHSYPSVHLNPIPDFLFMHDSDSW